MTRPFTNALVVAAAVYLASACDDSPTSGSDQIVGSGNLVTESRDVSGFVGVVLSGVGRLTMEHGETESLTITAEDNIMPLLVSEVSDDILSLGPRPGTALSPTRDIVYRLTFREMRSVVASGVTRIEAMGIDTDLLSVVASGVSTVSASGTADLQSVVMSGTTNYLAAELETRVAILDISGLARVVINASERLEGAVSGSAIVEYIGSPQISVNVSGTATLVPR
ncbi:MAG TPA: DUF2807 domain-containing protein [Vicinamibacteria bacterium]|nr:DUF2807 domain-containing protein [Vicinamibacteria bacterium]